MPPEAVPATPHTVDTGEENERIDITPDSHPRLPWMVVVAYTGDVIIVPAFCWHLVISDAAGAPPSILATQPALRTYLAARRTRMHIRRTHPAAIAGRVCADAGSHVLLAGCHCWCRCLRPACPARCACASLVLPAHALPPNRLHDCVLQRPRRSPHTATAPSLHAVSSVAQRQHASSTIPGQCSSDAIRAVQLPAGTMPAFGQRAGARIRFNAPPVPPGATAAVLVGAALPSVNIHTQLHSSVTAEAGTPGANHQPTYTTIQPSMSPKFTLCVLLCVLSCMRVCPANVLRPPMHS